MAKWLTKMSRSRPGAGAKPSATQVAATTTATCIASTCGFALSRTIAVGSAAGSRRPGARGRGRSRSQASAASGTGQDFFPLRQRAADRRGTGAGQAVVHRLGRDAEPRRDVGQRGTIRAEIERRGLGLLRGPAGGALVEEIDDGVVQGRKAGAVDGDPAPARHVVEGVARGLEGRAARIGEAVGPEAVDAADADRRARGEPGVGAAQPGDRRQRRPQAAARVGDAELPAVAAKAGEAGVDAGGPAGDLAAPPRRAPPSPVPPPRGRRGSNGSGRRSGRPPRSGCARQAYELDRLDIKS